MTSPAGDAFTIDCLEAERDILDNRILDAISYLLGNQDVGYGISPVGVQTLLDILRGEWEA